MLYLVTLSYIRPIDEVNKHLDTHRDWLVANTRSGQILFAGPLEDRTGGFLLARADSRDELNRLLDLALKGCADLTKIQAEALA